MAGFEKSSKDKKMDKVFGLKEGSKREEAMDAARYKGAKAGKGGKSAKPRKKAC